MTSTSPVFILSCERSGSTLLRYILDSHPDICCPGELFLGTLTKDLCLTVSRTIGLAGGGSLEDQDKATRQEVNRILTELLSKFARIRGKKILCEKTPYNLKHLKEIEWIFPDARYICLYRDSLDVVQSCLDLPDKELIWWALPYIVKYQRNYIAAFLESWAEKTAMMLDFENRRPQTCRILYETLIKDPKKALDPVFKFLGLDWDLSLLDRVFSVSHDQGGGDLKIGSTTKIEKDRVGKGA